LNKTDIYVSNVDLSKIMTFQLVKMTQHQAVVPINICFLFFRPTTINQFINI
jgi:hypothetical protein